MDNGDNFEEGVLIVDESETVAPEQFNAKKLPATPKPQQPVLQGSTISHENSSSKRTKTSKTAYASRLVKVQPFMTG